MKKIYDENLIKIYQFNHELENPKKTLEEVKNSNIYKCLQKYCQGNKEDLYNYIQYNNFGYEDILNHGYIRILGFIIDFSKLMKKYLVCHEYLNKYTKYYCFNKTLLRKSLNRKTSEILEYNGKY